MKKQFYEMIATDPWLQAKIASAMDDDFENIRELAKNEDSILTLPKIQVMIVNRYNQCMPDGLKIGTHDLFPSYNASFKNSFIELEAV